MNLWGINLSLKCTNFQNIIYLLIFLIIDWPVKIRFCSNGAGKKRQAADKSGWTPIFRAELPHRTGATVWGVEITTRRNVESIFDLGISSRFSLDKTDSDISES